MSPQVRPLSKRQGEVQNALATGKGNKQIAYELGITEKTLRFYTSKLYQKVGVQSRAELIVKVFQKRIDELEFVRLALMQRVRELEAA